MAPPQPQGMARKSQVPNVNRRVSQAETRRSIYRWDRGLRRVGVPAGARAGACYVRAAVPRRGAPLRGATAAAAAAALALAGGCGGGTRQDAGEQEATYPVAVAHASFPARQDLAEHAEMRIAVRNLGDRTIPNLAATIEAGGGGTEVDAFGYLTDAAGVASRSRPAWIVDEGPRGGDTAAPGTWALGPLRPHRTRTFVWHVSAVRAGSYTITYRLSGSLTGRSQLRLADGSAAGGRFIVRVNRRPAQVRVTADGRIVRVPPH